MTGKESSISVTVRVRPFTESEQANLQPNYEDQVFMGDGNLAAPVVSKYNVKKLRKVVNVVDDKMLIFDPPENNPIVRMQKAAFPGQTSRIREHRFVFDRLFDEDCSQEEVYQNSTQPLLDCVLDGYNSTVFAYGVSNRVFLLGLM